VTVPEGSAVSGGSSTSGYSGWVIVVDVTAVVVVTGYVLPIVVVAVAHEVVESGGEVVTGNVVLVKVPKIDDVVYVITVVVVEVEVVVFLMEVVHVVLIVVVVVEVVVFLVEVVCVVLIVVAVVCGITVVRVVLVAVTVVTGISLCSGDVAGCVAVTRTVVTLTSCVRSVVHAADVNDTGAEAVVLPDVFADVVISGFGAVVVTAVLTVVSLISPCGYVTETVVTLCSCDSGTEVVVFAGDVVTFVSSVMIFRELNFFSRASLTVSFLITKIPVRIMANILAKAYVYRLITAARFLLRASLRSASRNTSSANSS